MIYGNAGRAVRRSALPRACAATALFAGASIGVSALYAPVETRRVPVARLVENLERRVSESPNDVQLLINLARLHGMAYATQSETVPARRDPVRGDEMPWYGHEPRLIPYRAKPAETSAAAAAAREHLTKALERYEQALALEPDNLAALLGYGWMLDQAGEDARAADQYRRVIAAAWPREQGIKHLSPGQRSYTQEAAEYLLPLLNVDRDAAEIAELRSRQAHFDRLPRAITPIAIPLGAAISSDRIHDPSARVRFDADGSGLRREWTWITADAGWLVYDAEGRGEISSALQLFGSVTFWLFWQNGYEALRALDGNDDGELSGVELIRLAIWHDRSRDGVSDAGEVAPLASYGIVALSWRHCDGDRETFAAVSPRGVRFADGSTRPTYDVILKSTLDSDASTVSPRMPAARRTGSLPRLGVR